jgi:hypothetical protein
MIVTQTKYLGRALFILAAALPACTGADGSDGMNGANGADGTDGSIVQTSSEPAGANCADGGTKLEIGHDGDGDGTLAGAEIEQTVYACNGDPGPAGTSGAQSLIVVTPESPGANCAAGGQKIEYGIDDDDSGTLETREVDGTEYVCNGSDGLISLIATADEPVGANCVFGGTKITSGVDDNDNGTLEESEVDSTAYVCDAEPAATLYLSQDSNGNGLYRLDPATGAATNVGMSGVTSMTVGLTYDPSEGVLLGSNPNGLLAIMPDGSGSTNRGGTTTEALAYDYVNGVLYGAINGLFFTVDKATGANTGALAVPGFDAEGLAFRADTGTIYAIGGSSNQLYAYDIASGTWSAVGTHGLNLDDAGLTYDPWHDVLYATGGGDGNLYRISASTGEATLVGSTGLATANGGIELVFSVYP